MKLAGRHAVWSKVILLTAAVAAVGAAAELPRKFTETIKGTQKRAPGKTASFEMVLIPGGKFLMGSPMDEEDRNRDEGPQHEVQISPFYLCTTETTFDLFMIYYAEVIGKDWLKVLERKKKRFKPEQLPDPALPRSEKGINNLALADIYSADAVRRTGFLKLPILGGDLGWGKGKRPAMQVTWFTAVNFCRWLRRKTGRKYRLPSEAEWEYACRAGSKTAYYFGDDPDDLEDYAWYEDNSDDKTHPAAQKKPNRWGLFDMHGNVMEWCHDFYDPKAYERNAKARPARDPFGPKLPTKPKGKKELEIHERYHVARGGAWNSPPEAIRSAARGRERPSWRYKDPQYPKSFWWLPEMGHIGFRVACEAEGVVKKK